mmetsp:Transcript_93970/g.261069  ORF Transcript_93970/g.261069 Transcript_93970/m.261069 type:complete len:89 (+) Transcript_93970:1-267(+)
MPFADIAEVLTVEENTWEAFPRQWAGAFSADEAKRLVRVTYKNSDRRFCMLNLLAPMRMSAQDFRTALRVLRSKARKAQQRQRQPTAP